MNKYILQINKIIIEISKEKEMLEKDISVYRQTHKIEVLESIIIKLKENQIELEFGIIKI